MKRLLSVLLVFCMLFSCFACNITAFANDEGGFTGGNVQDNMGADDENPYIVAFNDFSMANKPSDEAFCITNIGGENGKVLEIKYYVGYRALETADKFDSYTWNGKTHTTFFEELEIGEKYILSYDYKSLTTAFEDGSSGFGAFSIAPKHNAFLVANGDYRDHPPLHSDRLWHRYAVAFTADKDKLNVKLHTANTRINSYIDNYCIQKAASISIEEGAFIKILSGNTITPKGEDGLWVAKGDKIKFKLSTYNGIKTTIKMGSTTVTPTSDGIYTIDKITSDIKISTVYDKSIVTNKYKVKDNFIYIPNQATKSSIRSNLNIGYDYIQVTNNEGQAKPDDQYLVNGDKISTYFKGEKLDEFIVYTPGNTNPEIDNKITVVDLNKVLDRVFDNPKSAPEGYDMDANDIITVSDVVNVRNQILLWHDNKSPKTDVVAKMDTYLSNMMNAVTGFTPTLDNLKNGIFNKGNRSRLVKAMEKAMSGQTVTIVGFGGSITENAGCWVPPSNTISTELPLGVCYLDIVCNWWEEMFGSVNKVNAGIGATDSVLGTHRMGDDVLAHNPDIVICEYSVNDEMVYPEKQATYENMVKKFLQEDVAVVMLALTRNNAETSQVLQEPIAQLYDVPMVSTKNAYSSITNFEKLFKDPAHPNVAGHAMWGVAVNYLLTETYKELATTTTINSALPSVWVHPESDYCDGAFVANISDIEKNKYEGVTLESLGCFKKSEKTDNFACRSYYGYEAQYSADNIYEPMVFKVKNLKTLYILMRRIQAGPNMPFAVRVNGVNIVSDTFNCNKGKRTQVQSEDQFHYASSLVCHYENGKDVTIEIAPRDVEEGGTVTIYSLLLSL